MNPFDDPRLVANFLEKRQSPKSINNVLDGPMLLDLMGDLTNKIVVEIGCGNGSWCRNLSGRALSEYWGIDISTPFIDIARSSVSDPRFHFDRADVNEVFPGVTTD